MRCSVQLVTNVIGHAKEGLKKSLVLLKPNIKVVEKQLRLLENVRNGLFYHYFRSFFTLKRNVRILYH